MNEKKPFNPQGSKKEGPKPQQGPKTYLKHGEFEKRNENSRCNPDFKPKGGDK